ncbi:SEC14-like protein 5 [Seminavis robusta]|uniref:SEC14-like protein 5 n=1 Tax=Seminavis robusta TaxID=568900 RepID=A0A9N8HN73_9STRA|nr:SEC14-like protein 5 [Seminavis robusta]|eukprot:Sro799_g204150.1 SEC14-like protein 5 (379) ;mRNA; r:31759-32895
MNFNNKTTTASSYTTSTSSVHSDLDEYPEVEKCDIALNGNGLDAPLSKDQLFLIQELHERVTPYREALSPLDAEFCDLETCRRYLVARQWSLEKAQEQLVSTLQWRATTNPRKTELWQSPKCLNNPLALNMRVVGYDADGRPIGYTRFSEAHDRWDADANIEHVLLLLEASCNFLRQRRKNGLNQTADSRHCVWVADFDGFGFRDSDPKSAILVAQLLQHYPEMLHCVVLIDAPMIFNGLWKLVSPLLDERVRSKVMFVKGKHAADLLEERLGTEAATWLADETKDSHEKRAQAKQGNPKKYWIAPPVGSGEHNPRGAPSYVDSLYYIKTPGDAFEEAKRQPNAVQENANARQLVNGTNDNLPRTNPCRVKTLYAGVF